MDVVFINFRWTHLDEGHVDGVEEVCGHGVHGARREEDALLRCVALQLPVLLLGELQVALVLTVGAAPRPIRDE